MARYAFACAENHETVVTHPMEGPPLPTRVVCECGRLAHRVYGFNFQEDRTRFFRNPVDGTKFSYALGREMPDNRSEYHQLLDANRCEPVTRGTMPSQWKENAEYLEHVVHGGERDMPPPLGGKPVGKTVLQQMRESNFRVGA